MSRLTDKFSLMKNMNRDELKEYLKTLTDNDKDMLLISFIKMYQSHDAMGSLLSKLDSAINDMECGRIQTIDEAWKEIGTI